MYHVWKPYLLQVKSKMYLSFLAKNLQKSEYFSPKNRGFSGGQT